MNGLSYNQTKAKLIVVPASSTSAIPTSAAQPERKSSMQLHSRNLGKPLVNLNGAKEMLPMDATTGPRTFRSKGKESPLTPEKKSAEKSTKEKDAEVKKEIKKKEKGKISKRDKMVEGETCKSNQFTWKIISVLGSGGFGDVYKVVKVDDPIDKTEYAMKTEMVTGEKRMLRLKVEVEALMKCNELKNRKHFVEIVDRGKTNKFKFVVMSLVGASLEDYRKKYDVDFTTSTAMQIAVQTIEALRDFHQAGWLHRDIKPQNFAYGHGDRETIIYILDFGIAKKIFDKDKQVKKPRARVKFLGTLRFASRTCHHCLEQGRKDDLETWIYMIFDIFDRKKGLPWKKEPDRTQVIVKKESFCKDKAWFNKYYDEHFPLLKEFYLIIEHLTELDYYEEPRYEPIKHHLLQTAKKKSIDLTLPLDWTIKDKYKEKKMEKVPENKEFSDGNKQEGSIDSADDDKGPFKGLRRRKSNEERRSKRAEY